MCVEIAFPYHLRKEKNYAILIGGAKAKAGIEFNSIQSLKSFVSYAISNSFLFGPKLIIQSGKLYLGSFFTCFCFY